jgi:Flp pilus assembly pilin Flp
MGLRFRRIAERLWGGPDPERGASMVEYALLLALMAVALIAALQFFAGERVESWERIGSAMP